MTGQALNIARSGLKVYETNLGVKAQNLSASAVVGYKKQFLSAADLGYQDLAGGIASDTTGTNSPSLQQGLGVKVAGIFRVFHQGDMVNTGRPYDLAIGGDGFFQVTLPDGTTGYTRAGIFNPGPDGTLQMIPSGFTLTPSIAIPANTESVRVDADGKVYAKITGQANAQQLGQLTLAVFMNPAGLRSIGDNIFVESESSGTVVTASPGTNGAGKLHQGYQEGSNVNAVEEITDLVKIQRGYEMLTKVLHAADGMMESTNRAV